MVNITLSGRTKTMGEWREEIKKNKRFIRNGGENVERYKTNIRRIERAITKKQASEKDRMELKKGKMMGGIKVTVTEPSKYVPKKKPEITASPYVMPKPSAKKIRISVNVELDIWMNLLKRKAIKTPVPFSGNDMMGLVILVKILKDSNNECIIKKNYGAMKKFKTSGVKNIFMISINETEKNGEMRDPVSNNPILSDFNLNLIKKTFLRCKKNDKMLIIPLKLAWQKTGKIARHANMLVFNHKRNEIERLEPHGRMSGLNEPYDKIVNTRLRRLKVELNKIMPKEEQFKLKTPEDLCPLQITKDYFSLQGKTEGLPKTQNIIFKDKIFTEGVEVTKKSGFCKLWSIFLLSLRLKSPELSNLQIYKNMVLDYKNNTRDLLEIVFYFTKYAYDELLRLMKILKLSDEQIKKFINENIIGETKTFTPESRKIYVDLEALILSTVN